MKSPSKLTLLLALFLMVSIPAAAQSIQQIAQQGMSNAQLNYQMSQSLYSMSRDTGDQQGMQLCQNEMAMHERTYNCLSQIVQNPGLVTNPEAFYSDLMEYYYRAKYRDLRPSQYIQQELAQFKALSAWQNGTPEGRRSLQAERNLQQSQFEASQQAYQARSRSFDAQNAAWRNGQAASDYSQRATINNVWDRSEYVNPNSGQLYTSPNIYDGQTHYDPNTGEELMPNQRYRNW